MKTPARGIATPPSTAVPLSEVLAALSRALDLTEGQPLGHCVRACVIGMRLGQEIGLGEEQLAALYYALLMKDAGCSSNASRMAALYGSDDRFVKRELKTLDWDDRVHIAFETWKHTAQNQGLWSRMRYFLGIARQENVTKDIIAARCERGADIAARLEFPIDTVEAIRSLDEHWNGKGYPEGLQGNDIPLLSRILNIAQTVEVFLATGGVDAAMRVLRERRGRWFDPDLVDEVLDWRFDTRWWNAIETPEAEQVVLTLEPALRVRHVDNEGLDRVATAFADIIDAKSPFTYKHSSNVAAYACDIGEALGFDAEALRRTRLAGLLHDIGKLGISNRILDKSGPLTAEERDAMAQHPLFTWDILSHMSAFAPFARQAATHHEKLDGTGYPWQLRSDDLDVPARVLVVADIYEALTANRPYREGLSPVAALQLMNRDRDTKLDAQCIDALTERIEDRGPRTEVTRNEE